MLAGTVGIALIGDVAKVLLKRVFERNPRARRPWLCDPLSGRLDFLIFGVFGFRVDVMNTEQWCPLEKKRGSPSKGREELGRVYIPPQGYLALFVWVSRHRFPHICHCVRARVCVCVCARACVVA